MDIRDKRILVLGGFGLVGQAVIKRMMHEKPACVVVTSISKQEAETAVEELRKKYSAESATFEAEWGNIFVRDAWKDLPREELLNNAETRGSLIDDILIELTEDVLTSNALYRLIARTKPDAIVDCINTSTAIAYQDIFTLSQRVRKATRDASPDAPELVERLLSSLYIPQLIRHIQILHRALIDAKVTAYLKVGTSGTGGMGLNIPFTHSEERPSRVLLSKSSIAGAHSLLLFLMSRTPHAATIVKEIKPTATIAWKKVGFGPIKKGGKAIELHDVTIEEAETLGATLNLLDPRIGRETGQQLEAVYIDTGENGIFSRGEFEAISALGQMELITPEEIAENITRELLGATTGKDIVSALDGATMGPTYRAGYLRESALRMMESLELETGTSSVAFEMLGPPRLAKLLFEGHLLRLVAKDFAGVRNLDEAGLAEMCEAIISTNAKLRSQMISIGIPILLPDGRRLVRGRQIKIPPAKVSAQVSLADGKMNDYAREGWVDLRPQNMTIWKTRLEAIHQEALRANGSTGSEFDRSPEYWDNFSTLNEGRIAAWVFAVEEGGERVMR